MTKEQLQILFDQRSAAGEELDTARAKPKPFSLETDLSYRKALSKFVRADDAYLAAASEFNQQEAA